MSNYLAIATISAALQEIIQGAVNEVLPGVPVRGGPPRTVKPGDREVNLYLYQITPNAQMRNADLPRWSSDGTLTRLPMFAVKLHYMITFAGEEQLAAERMLGRVVSQFHAAPMLDRFFLAKLVAADGSFPYLAGSDLDQQRDTIMITPEQLTFDELSKLWTSFANIGHRPLLLYVVSPVMIDAPAADARYLAPLGQELVE